MARLTHFKSFEDMKASKNINSSNKNLAQKESDLKDFITLLKKNSVLTHPPQTNPSNQSKGGK